MIPFNFLGRRTTPALNDSIANIYSPKYSRKLAADRNILLASGARDALQSTLVTLLSKGDEVILFDPSYEIYRNAILKTGAIPIGIPLTPKNMVHSTLIQLSKSDILARKDPYRSTSMDRWEIDLELLERSITSKTKAIIINSPHNPTGKIFTHDEISGLASILNRYKNITVVDDRVYEHTNFDRLG
jgi:aspartate/methionine/tyrosine aminotransferase